MCIVAIAWQVLDDMPICLISNRDEFYHRPSSGIHRWPNSPIVAGQDLQSGGTWMGVTASGRWAVVTNFRNGHEKQDYSTSRGHLIQQFLESDLSPIRFAQALEQQQTNYAGFNLFLGMTDQAVYMSNRGEAPQMLAKGVYVVSNGLRHDDWAKTRHLRKRFTQELLPLLQLRPEQQSAYDVDYAVWDILQDERKQATELLPQTGISPEMEQLLSSTFIQSPVYGTRCSNFLSLKGQGWHWKEKIQHGDNAGQSTVLHIPIQQTKSEKSSCCIELK